MSKMAPSEQPMEQTTPLPLEIVDLVLDHAEFWPHTTTISPRLGLVPTPVKWRDTSSNIVSPSWPSPESKAMQEVFGFTLYSPPLASESSLNRAATLRKGLRRLVLKDLETTMPPRGRHPARMIVFEAVSQRYDSQTAKFCEVGIIRKKDQPLEQDVPEAESQRRDSGVFSAFRSNRRPSKPAKSAKPRKAHQLAAQRECWFPPGAKAEGKYVIIWKRDEDLKDGIQEHDDGNTMPTTTDFIRKLKVGDSVGLWAPVVRGNCVYRIDEVRMHTFWAV